MFCCSTSRDRRANSPASLFAHGLEIGRALLARPPLVVELDAQPDQILLGGGQTGALTHELAAEAVRLGRQAHAPVGGIRQPRLRRP